VAERRVAISADGGAGYSEDDGRHVSVMKSGSDGCGVAWRHVHGRHASWRDHIANHGARGVLRQIPERQQREVGFRHAAQGSKVVRPRIGVTDVK